MLINTKINSATSFTLTNGIINNSIMKTESVLCVEERNREYGDDEFNDNKCSKKIIIKNKQIKNQENSNENKENKILEKIEILGYDKKYVKKCLENNLLCQASSIYFLLMNYDNI